MPITPEDLDDQTNFRQILSLPYKEIIGFVLSYLGKRSGLTFFFWSACIITLIITVIVRISTSGVYHNSGILIHTAFGLLLFPVLCIPVHEALHIIPYYISGARNIRVGMDLKQYLFYVTAHKYVASPIQFKIVAILPFILISVASTLIIVFSPGLWKWSFSLFLFVHTTMCAGDFALLNFYFLNRKKKIYTWDDADRKVAYFYEKL